MNVLTAVNVQWPYSWMRLFVVGGIFSAVAELK